MTFSSLVFICIFLPIVFLLHLIIPSLKVKNLLLIVASLLFYAFGEPVYVLLMILSAIMNYLFALMIDKSKPKLFLILAVIFNIGVLFVFKYTGLFVQSINSILNLGIPVPNITLPIGISFFTFQALSYVIDVYRKETEVQKNFLKVLLYISFFPQLIAGPIVKYKDIEKEINDRSVEVDEIALGLRRFIFGLAKKVLIANTMAVCADAIFDGGFTNVNIIGAWLGAIAYTLQIYFDFSGYSDMAIGMGRMFGFHFKENFDFPYVAVTIKEFWRRWHISLSSWFKDYVYIPLGGNRKGAFRAGLNKFIVFFLCGLWHGASWTFVVWGLIHGLFSFLEEFVGGIKKLPRFIGHIYTMLVVCISFVIFRAETFTEAFGMIKTMFTGFDFSLTCTSVFMSQVTPYFIFMLVMGIIFSAPVEKMVKNLRATSEVSISNKKDYTVQLCLYIFAFILLAWCIIRLSGGSYNPFIYFRF